MNVEPENQQSISPAPNNNSPSDEPRVSQGTPVYENGQKSAEPPISTVSPQGQSTSVPNSIPPAPQPYASSDSPLQQAPTSYPTKQGDGLGISSIILAFIAPPIGLILGIVGLVKAKKHNASKTTSIIGTILSAIFCLIAAAVIFVFAIAVSTIKIGINSASADTERKADIIALHTMLEAYNVTNGAYPTLEQLNDSAWRTQNAKGVDSAAYIDPQSTQPTLAANPTSGSYAYQATSCTAAGCKQYTLTATLEGADGPTLYTKKSLDF